MRSFLSRISLGKTHGTRTARQRSGAGGAARGRGSTRTARAKAGGKGASRTGPAKRTSRTRRTGSAKGGKAAGGGKPRTRKETTGALRRAWQCFRRPPEAVAEPVEAAPARRQPPFLLRALIMLVAFGGMVAFAVVLSRLTLEPSVASQHLTHSNLRPGDSISAYLSQPAFRDTLKQLGGNVLLGVPFGLLLPVMAPQTRGLLRVILATAVVMMLVELVQGALVTGRAFDIDDVLLNTSGAVLGYLLLGRRVARAVHPPRPHWWHRWTRSPAPR